MNNNKTIHHIFIDINLHKTYEENPIYLKCVEENKKRQDDFTIKIWNEKMLDNLVKTKYNNYLDFWNSFPNKFWKIDFGRYLILLEEGGIYVDMDDIILEKIDLNQPYILVNYYNKNLKKYEFCNNIMYYRDKNIYKSLIEFSIERFRICKMPKEWKIRRFFYIVSAKMYNQFNKKKLGLDPTNIKYSIDFTSYGTNSWLKTKW